MIIGIDASKAAVTNRTGLENYVFELILNLKKIDQNNTYFLYTNADLPKELLGANFQEKKLAVKRLWSRFFLNRALKKWPCQVHLQPSNFMPKNAPGNSIAVIHDLASYIFPAAFSSSERKKQKVSLENLIEKSKRIICVSSATQLDLHRFYPETEGRTTVVHLGIDLEKFKNTARNAPAKPFLLYVGRIEERKNTKRLIDAFARLKKENQIPHDLVLAGGRGFGAEEVIAKINAEPSLRKTIRLAGFVDDPELRKLYAGADAFVFPSTYEGFGLPILEAFASGVPVITSNISSMPEIAGNAAILFDPLDEVDIAAKIYSVISDERLKRDLRVKGDQQVRKFSWHKTAQETFNLINSLK